MIWEFVGKKCAIGGLKGELCSTIDARQWTYLISSSGKLDHSRGQSHVDV